MKVGDEFPTFIQFKEVLDAYSNDNSVSTYICDSMKMATAQKRRLKRPVSADLVYHSIKYGCVKGGTLLFYKNNFIRTSRLKIAKN